MIYISHISIMFLTFFTVIIGSVFHPIIGGFIATIIVGLHWVIIAAYKDIIKRFDEKLEKDKQMKCRKCNKKGKHWFKKICPECTKLEDKPNEKT